MVGLNLEIVMKVRVWSDGQASMSYTGHGRAGELSGVVMGADVVKELTTVAEEVLVALPVEGEG